VADVAGRLGISSTHSLYAWLKRYGAQNGQHDEQQAEARRLKAELKRVTEERDILKKAAAYFAKVSG
jgi:transposase